MRSKSQLTPKSLSIDSLLEIVHLDFIKTLGARTKTVKQAVKNALRFCGQRSAMSASTALRLLIKVFANVMLASSEALTAHFAAPSTVHLAPPTRKKPQQLATPARTGFSFRPRRRLARASETSNLKLALHAPEILISTGKDVKLAVILLARTD